MGTLDLHMHSTASDGSLAPDALVRFARECGVRTMALTDHDTVAGVDLAQRTAQLEGLTFVTGIEISTIYAGKTFMLWDLASIRTTKSCSLSQRRCVLSEIAVPF